MRINIQISDELNAKLDEVSSRYGISKSQMCGFIIGQYMDNTTKMQNAVYGSEENEGLIKKLFSDLIREQDK